MIVLAAVPKFLRLNHNIVRGGAGPCRVGVGENGAHLGARLYPQHAMQVHEEPPLVNSCLAGLCHGLRCAAEVRARQVLLPCTQGDPYTCCTQGRWGGGGWGVKIGEFKGPDKADVESWEMCQEHRG